MYLSIGNLFSFFLITLILSKLTIQNIKVVEPADLAIQINYKIPSKFSDYGQLHYGKTIRGQLYFDPTNLKNQLACTEIEKNEYLNFNDSIQNKNDDDNNENEIVRIMLVDRGNCSFVTKTRNIEKAGFHVALIVNHIQNFNSIFEIKDDGTGSDLDITTILIPEKEGDILKYYFKQDQDISFNLKNVMLEIDNTHEELTETVKFKIFFNPSDLKVYKLVDEILSLDKHILIGNDFDFIPVYAFDLSMDTEEYINVLQSKGRCMCGTKYCEDFGITEGITGNDLLIEAIRQKCLHLIFFNKLEKSVYFKYLRKYYQKCAKSSNFSKNCSVSVLNEINPKYENEVNQCFYFSFDLGSEKTYTSKEDLFKKCHSNLYLQEHSHFLDRLMKKGLPLITTNDKVYYGKWNTSNIIEALCSGLISKDKYPNCTKFQHKEQNIKSNVNFYSLVAFIIIGIISCISIFIMCRCYLKKRTNKTKSTQIEQKPNSKVVDYLKLEFNQDNLDNILNTTQLTIENLDIDKKNPTANMLKQDN